MFFLGPLASFRHGVHPEEHKDATAGLAIERLPFGDEYVLPLSQHLGAPSKAIVEVGQRVERGQMIAAPGGDVSVGLHAPVTGTVRAIEMRPHPTGQRMPAIVVATDPFASQRLTGVAPPPLRPPTGAEFTRWVQEAGMVGLGGAAFPSHVKLSVPEGKKARFVILNGCECEPYLTCDHRVMVERPETVLRGLRLMMAEVGAERGYIGIESNKADAIDLLGRMVADDENLETVQDDPQAGADLNLHHHHRDLRHHGRLRPRSDRSGRPQGSRYLHLADCRQLPDSRPSGGVRLQASVPVGVRRRSRHVDRLSPWPWR